MLRLSRYSLYLFGLATQVCRRAAPLPSPRRWKKSAARSRSKTKRKLRRASRKTAATAAHPLSTHLHSHPTSSPNAPPPLSTSGGQRTPPLPSQHVSPFSFPREKLNLVTPVTLHARLRSTLVQLVLLSPEPLQPSALYKLYTKVVDAETADLFSCAARAVSLYNASPFGPATPLSSQHDEKSNVVVENNTPPPSNSDAGSEREKASEEALWHVGRTFVSAYRGSVLPVVAALRRREEQDLSMATSTSTTGVAAANRKKSYTGQGQTTDDYRGSSDVPASHEVDQWMLLHILYCDPELRVSAYGGAVCYPTLPSLLLATSDRMQGIGHSRESLALSWAPTSQGDAHAYRSYLASSSCPTITAGSRKQSSGSSPAVSPTRRHMSNFMWLNGAAGSPPWTLAHAELILYNAYATRNPTAESHRTTEGERNTEDAAEVAQTALKDLSGTSGHRLVDYFILQSPSMRLMSEEAAVTTTEVGDRGWTMGNDKAFARAFQTLGWNEGSHGSSRLQQYVNDLAAADGQYGFLLAKYPTMRQPSGELYRANLRILHGLFRHLAVPIAVSRVSTLLRWNLSIYHAGIYRSFFYFLLVMGANPTVHRMAAGMRQRIRATTRCADLFGHSRNDKTKDDKIRRSAEQQVRQALLALDATAASPESEPIKAESASLSLSLGLREGLRRAFVEERDMVHHFAFGDDRVVEVLCLRVLPHARPGSGSSQRSVSSPSSSLYSSFRGYQLRYIEVLPTWRRTPEETLNDLRAKQQWPSSSDPSCWLEKNEEPYILVCSMAALSVRGRLRATVERFSAFVHSGPMSLRQLSIITLWAHEYGVEMASEMLFVLMLLNPHCVRLHPPSTARTNYGEWVFEFI